MKYLELMDRLEFLIRACRNFLRLQSMQKQVEMAIDKNVYLNSILDVLENPSSYISFFRYIPDFKGPFVQLDYLVFCQNSEEKWNFISGKSDCAICST